MNRKELSLKKRKKMKIMKVLLQLMNPFITGSTEDPKREPVLEVTIEEEETPL